MTDHTTVRFDISDTDRALVRPIVDRAMALFAEWDIKAPCKSDLGMDLVATHSNGCPLDFPKLLTAKDGDFMHDIGGIGCYLDRGTGELTNCFVPRCALPEVTR